MSTASLEVAVGRDIRCRSCMRAMEDIGGGGREYEIYKGDLRLYNCAMDIQLAILDAERITRRRPPSISAQLEFYVKPRRSAADDWAFNSPWAVFNV